MGSIVTLLKENTFKDRKCELLDNKRSAVLTSDPDEAQRIPWVFQEHLHELFD